MIKLVMTEQLLKALTEGIDGRRTSIVTLELNENNPVITLHIQRTGEVIKTNSCNVRWESE